MTKRIEWHSFCHGLGAMLRQEGVDVKVAQEKLRHANPRITMEFYQQAVTDEKREAQRLVMERYWGSPKKIAFSSTQIAEAKEEVAISNCLILFWIW